MLNLQRLPPLAAAMAALGLALASTACGDSDETYSIEDARASYIADVDAICADTTAKIDTKTQEMLAGVPNPDAKDLEAIVAEVTVPALEEQYELIAAVGPPKGDEQQISKILAAADEAIAEVEKDPSSVLVVIGEPTPFDELNGLLADYGLTQCGPSEGG